MRQAAIWSGVLVMLAFLLVLAAVGVHDFAQEPAAPAQTAVQTTDPGAVDPTPADQQLSLRLKQGDTITEISMQEYLLGVLCCEMPLEFEPAALQAQAVASRTFTLYQCQRGKHIDCDVCADSNCCQAWKSEAQLQELFGEQWQNLRQRAADAISSTDGQVITLGGELINAVFFACSGGMTEPASAVWGAEVSYLQAVESPGEEIATSFTGQTSVSLESFCQTLQGENEAVDLSGSPSSWFGTVEYSAGGGVASMYIGGVNFTGTQLRSLFRLNSTCFTVAVESNAIVFETRGKGHRVGMSQYGAQAMALQGSDYVQILQHYYSGVSVTDYMVS